MRPCPATQGLARYPPSISAGALAPLAQRHLAAASMLSGNVLGTLLAYGPQHERGAVGGSSHRTAADHRRLIWTGLARGRAGVRGLALALMVTEFPLFGVAPGDGCPAVPRWLSAPAISSFAKAETARRAWSLE